MDKPTFESIVQEKGALIRWKIRRLGVRLGDIDDVAQEVLHAVARALPELDPSLSVNPSGAFHRWLFRICERQAARHRRKHHRAEVFCDPEELDGTGSPWPNAEEQWLAREREALLSELLEQVEPDRLIFVVAFDLEGVAMADLAVHLRIPATTAWNRLRLAREDLRAAGRRMRHRYS